MRQCETVDGWFDEDEEMTDITRFADGAIGTRMMLDSGGVLWRIRVGSTPYAYDPTFVEWLRALDIDLDLTYEVEIYGKRARIHQFAPGEDGRPYYDSAADDAARREPFVVDVEEWPECLLGA